MTGFAAHWNKNENFSAQFDRWFLNLFPREQPFVYNKGGYQTLSFIPTLGDDDPRPAGRRRAAQRTERARQAALARDGGPRRCSRAAGLLGGFGLCPIVKRIWTPSFVLWSGGLCFLLTALFYEIVDVRQKRRWTFPLLVLGMNSIAAYCLDEAFVKPLGRGTATTFHTRAVPRARPRAFEGTLVGARVSGVDLAGLVVDVPPQDLRAALVRSRCESCALRARCCGNSPLSAPS